MFQHVLNCDLSVYVFQIYYATKIQTNFRKWCLRHVKNAEWIHILKLLTTYLDFEQINLLTRQYWVRREWLLEPASWIFTLENNQCDLYKIVFDCGL